MPYVETFQRTPLPKVGRRVACANDVRSYSHAVLRVGYVRVVFVSLAVAGISDCRLATTVALNQERVYEPIRIYCLAASPALELGVLSTL